MNNKVATIDLQALCIGDTTQVIVPMGGGRLLATRTGEFRVCLVNEGSYLNKGENTMTTKKEILDQIKILQAKADALPEDKPKGRYKPEFYEEYFTVLLDGTILGDFWTNCSVNKHRLAIGNVFRTKGEGLRYVENLKTHYELMDLADYEPDWDDGKAVEVHVLFLGIRGSVVVESRGYYRLANTVYFRTKEKALAAVDKVGEDRVIAYLKGE